MRSSLVSHGAAVSKAQKQVSSLKTKLNNGLTLVAQDNQGAVSQLVLAFRAGSRYQSPSQNGLVHHIRNFVGRDAQSYPGLQLVWSAAASGATINSFATRDIFGVHISVPRDQTSYVLPILGHAAAKPAFKPWEFEDVNPTVLADIAAKSAYTIAFEDIHRAAYRTGNLSNSLYASKKDVGKFKSNEYTDFANKHFVTGNGVLVGVNVDSSILKSYADEYETIANGGAVSNGAAPFKGGDYRRAARGNDVHIMIAGNGATIGDVKAIATQHVLLQHLGKSSPLKFATLPGSTAGLAKLPTGAHGSAFQALYDGSGLVGAYVLANGSDGETAAKATVDALRNPKIKNLEDCKTRAVREILFSQENSTQTAYDLATTSLHNGPEHADLIAAINKVTASDIDQFAKKAFAKLAISCYGNHSRVPYSDEF